MPRLKTIPPRLKQAPTRVTSLPRTEAWSSGLTTTERGYGWRWQQARNRFLGRAENALCRMCAAEGRTVAATVVDHIVPHKGDQRLMWDEANWQPLCKLHHDSDKQKQEKAGAR